MHLPAGDRYWISECKNLFSSAAIEDDGYQWLARLTDCRTDMRAR